MLTFVLFWMLVYMWSIWGYVSYPDEYSSLGITKMYEFYTYLYDKTFKYDGGVGGFFEDATPATEKNELPRYFYDGIYNFFIVTLIFEIVLGIIIDTFRMLREMEAEMYDDMDNKCFLCGKMRHVFDELPDEKDRYPGHTAYQHNHWYYIYYLGYLGDKAITEYTGNEQYIGRLYRRNEVNWLPQGRAMSLEIEGEIDEMTLYDMILENINDTKKNLKTTRIYLKKLEDNKKDSNKEESGMMDSD